MWSREDASTAFTYLAFLTGYWDCIFLNIYIFSIYHNAFLWLIVHSLNTCKQRHWCKCLYCTIFRDAIHMTHILNLYIHYSFLAGGNNVSSYKKIVIWWQFLYRWKVNYFEEKLPFSSLLRSALWVSEALIRV